MVVRQHKVSAEPLHFVCYSQKLAGRSPAVGRGLAHCLAGSSDTFESPFRLRDGILIEGEAFCATLLPYPHSLVQVRRGVLAEESGALMKDFFRARRIENDGRSLDAASTGPADNLSATDLGMPET